MAKEKQVATDFQKIITEGRERKQAQALAAKVFRRDRVSSAPPKFAGAGGSLTSRAGINKRAPVSPAGPKPGSLAARIHAPGTQPPSATTGSGTGTANRAQRRVGARENALLQAEHDSSLAAQVNMANTNRYNHSSLGGRKRGGVLQQVATRPLPLSPALNNGITIRGLAGPFVVMAQNLAPGTTAGDLESAMMPVGGLVSKCRIIKTHPIVIAEIEFQTKEGADRVIERFNNQLADGRVLHVYAKVGGPPTSPARAAPRAPALQANGVLVDGSLGFEPMQVEESSSTGLYSDSLIGPAGPQSNNRRGRGFRGGRDYFDRSAGRQQASGWRGDYADTYQYGDRSPKDSGYAPGNATRRWDY
ncbi:hypothetical protein DHEL01_v208154 [Diaporthe helianthi]|uniref:RRM domain-containing protein n=1 Tax=Diaporthe helianthi TaxID=158607 RepID=A0A2P5HT55_DIAHE|nr:hypothetical protein DHEL01_v208154 [Diaporthe helianthi]